ncbi:hypothetical protein T10_4459 [Trichinella papuae]|uniref:Uncharacterized protein n=1 Tax=Trichinella papuae TaxID=268474 RepID=A0A0V1M407_9BILA|nr:hypothetical protein T10_6094 [Trichinella papuae]KRZ66499.1 hypothetical protein T10_4459 [Trichinella papuae]
MKLTSGSYTANEATGATRPPLLFIKTDSQKEASGLPGFGDVVSKQPFIKRSTGEQW